MISLDEAKQQIENSTGKRALECVLYKDLYIFTLAPKGPLDFSVLAMETDRRSVNKFTGEEALFYFGKDPIGYTNASKTNHKIFE